MELPEGLRYTAEHEWVRLDGNEATVGITDFAQEALGDVVFIELPKVGAQLAANEVCSEIESTKSVSEIYSPVAGTVVAANAALELTPELVNQQPYGDGWMFRLEVSAEDVSQLLDAAAYRALVEEA